MGTHFYAEPMLAFEVFMDQAYRLESHYCTLAKSNKGIKECFKQENVLKDNE